MKKSGFSIIELMIVVAIIAFLATIAVPKYFNYFSKAKQAEVAVNLASLYTAQQSYKASNGTYNKILSGEGGIGWKPRGYKGGGKQENFYYTYGFYFSGAKEGVNFFTGKLETPAKELGKCFADKEKFIAKAAGNLEKNKSDVWQINENKELKNIKNGLE